MQRCKCGTKLPIYVKNEKISSQKKYTKKLLRIHDLVVAEGRCHNRCKQKFYSGSPANTETPGQPKNLTRNENFNAVCEHLEAEAEIHALSEVYKKDA